MDIEDEIRQIVKEGIAEGFPTVVFPDVQRVYVENRQEIPAPIVNVPESIVNVTVPEIKFPEQKAPNVTVTVDNSEVAREIRSLKDELSKDRTDDILEAMDAQSKTLSDAYKAVKVIGGNASGSQSMLNQVGTIINPATTEKQDAIITAIGAIPGGGGVQYTEGDTDATITGTAIMWEDAGNALVAASAAKPLPVSASIDTTGLALAANQLPDGHNVTVDNASIAVTGTFWQATQPVSGTVTASAQPGVDIGDVTINNATIAVTQSGTWDEVGINDSGNSITVDNGGTFAVQNTNQSAAISATAVDATASGDNTIVSITNSPRLYYVSLSANGANSADVTAIVKMGATNKYKVSLKAGAIWARNIGAGHSYVTGASGDDIIVNLSAAQTVHVSVEYADV